MVTARAVQAQLADLVRKSVYIVLDNHGVVRRIENLGVKTLPYAMRAHMTKFDVGRYGPPLWISRFLRAIHRPMHSPPQTLRFCLRRTLLIRFDARPALAAELSRQLRNDDRVIRHTIFKRPKDEQLGIVKNEGISPLEALMNPNSLLGSLGDLSGLLDTPSSASSASSSSSLFGSLPSFSSSNNNSAAAGNAATEGAPAAGSAGASGSSLASWRRGWQPTTPSSRYGRSTGASAANGTDALASLSSLLTKRAAEGKKADGPAVAPGPATPASKP